ncbi:hypothetical protein KKC97_00170 [bacterium]|nr:hypothetical protein [bacterium]MBU1636065.1 hypothetical protein [bacterium]MBU1920335.1 hypothetical protein [bacterium]
MKSDSLSEEGEEREAGSKAVSDLYTTEGWIGQEQVFHLVIRDCPTVLKEAQFMFERNFVYTILRRHAGNVTLSSKVMGVSRRTLSRMIKNLGIDVHSLR